MKPFHRENHRPADATCHKTASRIALDVSERGAADA